NLFYTSSELQEKILSYCEHSAAEKDQQRAHMRTIACDKFDIRQTKAQIVQVINEVAASTNATRRVAA
ncbi:MAG TPA: hypothetical protein PKE45_15590, partial [Caldilineaceae bacterium]|nr:hypothetical protein [Caldilineaceae bacterium]